MPVSTSTWCRRRPSPQPSFDLLIHTSVQGRKFLKFRQVRCGRWRGRAASGRLPTESYALGVYAAHGEGRLRAGREKAESVFSVFAFSAVVIAGVRVQVTAVRLAFLP